MGAFDDILEALSQFDLEKNDAMLYLCLLQTGPTNVNTVSTKLGIDKGKIYRSLHKLQNWGLVSCTFSNPTICTAIDPERALASIIQRKEEQILTMHKVLKKISDEVSKYKNPQADVLQMPSFYIIQGRANIYARIGKVIEESTETVYIITTAHDLIRMNYTAIPEKIRICNDNGGQVRIITDIRSDINLLSKVDELGAAAVRLSILPSKSRVIVSEGKRLLMSGSMDESMSLNHETDSSLYTNSREIIDNMFSFSTHLWTLAEPQQIQFRNEPMV